MPENLRVMTENDYLLAWGAYLVAALGCLLVWFRLTGWMWRYVREPLRVLVRGAAVQPDHRCRSLAKSSWPRRSPLAPWTCCWDVGNNAWRAAG